MASTGYINSIFMWDFSQTASAAFIPYNRKFSDDIILVIRPKSIDY